MTLTAKLAAMFLLLFLADVVTARDSRALQQTYSTVQIAPGVQMLVPASQTSQAQPSQQQTSQQQYQAYQTQSAPVQQQPTQQPVQRSSGGQASGKISGDDPLAMSNSYRAVHGAQPLSWDQNLANSAQSWADNLASQCKFYHSGPGENLASGFQSWADVLWQWYGEQSQYNYNAPGYSSATGHFTQLIWASTTRLGCAVSKANCWQGQVWVCHYDPVGNVNSAEYFKQNVFPPS